MADIETLTGEERERILESPPLAFPGAHYVGKMLRIIDKLTAALAEARIERAEAIARARADNDMWRRRQLKERDAEIARLKQEGETMAAINRDQSERLVKTEHQLAYLKRCAQEGPGCDCVDVCKFRPAAPALRGHRCDVDTDHCPKCFPAPDPLTSVVHDAVARELESAGLRVPDPRDAATGESVRLGESCDVCHARTEVRYVCRRHAKELRDAR